jgi:thioredoxin
MAVVDLTTEEELEGLLQEKDILILDFWAPWCPPCKAFAPVFEAAADRHADVAFGRVNTQSDEELSKAFDVENIPTLVVVRERVMLAVEAGYLTGEQMDDLLRQAREVDMQALLEAEGGSSENQEESS